jgi:tetratricopeptide (TPR) repeat protein
LVLLVSPKEAYLLLGNSMLSQQHAERAGYLRSNIPSEELPSSYQWVLIGRSLATIAEWDLAMHAFKMAVETNPYYAEAWALFGEAREQLHLDGWPMLSMAYELDPGSVVVRALMAGYWYRKGDLEAAEKLFQAISQEETDEGTWLLEIARIAESRKKYKEALKLYQQAVTLEPEDPTFWLELSRFCATNGFQIREVGLQAARQAVLLSPAESNSHALMGWTLFLLGDLESSERILLHSLEIDRTDSKSHLYLGQVYLQAGKFHLARKHLEYAGSLDYGDDATVTMARRLLDQIQ